MWQRFTERARKVVFYAQEEAGRLGQKQVSTEHLLLGLIRENDSVACRLLDHLDVRLDHVRSEVERQAARGKGRSGQDAPLTPRAKRVIDLAYDEARQLDNNYIGTEHLLLGLVREGEGLAGRVLSALGVDFERTREEVQRLQSSGAEAEAGAGPDQKPVGQKPMDWRRFTRRAREAVSCALDEAVKRGERGISPEHLLLGLARENAGVSPRRLRPAPDWHLTERARRAIDLAYLEARRHGAYYVGTDHLRLGVMGESGGLVERTLPEEDALHKSDYEEAERPQARNPSQRMGPPPRGRSDLYDVLGETRLRGRDIIGIEQLSAEEIGLILDVAARLKAHKFDETQTLFAKGQTLAMLFEKPSLRTRVTFEAGMTQLGGNAIYLEGRLGIRETVPDVARNLDRWIDGIMARTFDHAAVLDLAEYATIPVINGLSDREHPCQAFADFQTLAERKGDVQGLTLAYVGDGNNVAHSLMLLAAKVGTHFRLGCPAGYEPDADLWQTALAFAQETGATLTLTHDPAEAAQDADAVYTDVWASMGQEEEAAARATVFAPFQVNAALMARAKPDALVMHCLPAHRGEEITADVLDGPHSVVFDQAENRLHAQKAILALVL